MKFKKAIYRTPNRMQANTGHKTFDRQADYVGTGNVLSNIQTSSFIRPFTETECNGFTSPEGHLREFDLKPFIQTRMPAHIAARVRELTQTEAAILYRFQHHNSEGAVVHGYAVTRSGTHQLIATFVTGSTQKSKKVVDWCLQYITPEPESAAA